MDVQTVMASELIGRITVCTRWTATDVSHHWWIDIWCYWISYCCDWSLHNQVFSITVLRTEITCDSQTAVNLAAHLQVSVPEQQLQRPGISFLQSDWYCIHHGARYWAEWCVGPHIRCFAHWTLQLKKLWLLPPVKSVLATTRHLFKYFRSFSRASRNCWGWDDANR